MREATEMIEDCRPNTEDLEETPEERQERLRKEYKLAVLRSGAAAEALQKASPRDDAGTYRELKERAKRAKAGVKAASKAFRDSIPRS